jgi:hypothetical protein
VNSDLLVHAGEKEYDNQDEEISRCSDTPDGDVDDFEGKFTDGGNDYVIGSISTASRDPSPPGPATAATVVAAVSLGAVVLFMLNKLLSDH